MNSKFGMFSVLVLGVMMLLIPATSIANAQEYDDSYYEQDRDYDGIYQDNNHMKSNYANESYKKQDDNTDEPIVKKEKKKMKEPPMLLVKKDVLYCDVVANGNCGNCIDLQSIPGPDSNRWVQDCTATNEFQEVYDNINEEFFKIIVTDDIEFPSSEEGKKLNFNGDRYTVTEDQDTPNEELSSNCQEGGFDSGFRLFFDETFVDICTINEGECSDIIQDNQSKECTVKNYVAEFED